MRYYGYARVSTGSQSIAAQVDELRAAGAERVYNEAVSGAHANRCELRKVLAQLGEGDVLLVTRLDRLARSTRDLLSILDQIADRGALLRSLGDPWADPTTPSGRMMLTMVGSVAEFERELIHARTKEGRERAKARGVRFGAPGKLTDYQRQEALERLDRGDAPSEVARCYGVSRWTIQRLRKSRFEGVPPRHPEARLGRDTVKASRIGRPKSPQIDIEDYIASMPKQVGSLL